MTLRFASDPLQCPCCDFVAPGDNVLRIHYGVSHGDPMFAKGTLHDEPCPVCGAGCKAKASSTEIAVEISPCPLHAEARELFEAARDFVGQYSAAAQTRLLRVIKRIEKGGE